MAAPVQTRSALAAARLRELADAIEGALGDEGEDSPGWAESLREIAAYIEPETNLAPAPEWARRLAVR